MLQKPFSVSLPLEERFDLIDYCPSIWHCLDINIYFLVYIYMSVGAGLEAFHYQYRHKNTASMNKNISVWLLDTRQLLLLQCKVYSLCMCTYILRLCWILNRDLLSNTLWSHNHACRKKKKSHFQQWMWLLPSSVKPCYIHQSSQLWGQEEKMQGL